ncbi:Fe-Mn family superoxide dismutase [Candidatus Palibaumannia cicadellinicola]|uniref:Superoxide dismutase n=1 Tax=Baumannia cicadellinicola subsp. Homalodisca coagulata TaxID=374463 RepID=Q1LSZ4_BAUCH|nr:Fe-Mn family superoxide dismutase [Candidatus Baumannia cicadellinicola]ABF13804.1 manganese superoxide dismutase [Baumannia cicadellinicola str. Hc (Homalodisca coagulata)]MBS0032763.1 superoxide dismutase [Mn] [Candidatus Baumannia cicadellinicola]MCJ7462042.1 superoxide dismutase [Mn] [Candidatus Baumannia cicadellinicola]MCJ7463069.1 superoxide dismutase [Mn] [Candidatus Baumannia cicadellinicola]
MIFMLPTLPYRFDAFEPFIDQTTMEIHYTKHHQNYITNANLILESLPQFAQLSVEELIQQLDQVPHNKKMALRNYAGGHANHSLFWKLLKHGTKIQGKLKNAIESDFGSIIIFQELFEQVAMNCFGSGWAWLVKKNNQLLVVSTANQDNPLMGENISSVSGYPILGLDVWEHAYYLKYQNRRSDYIKSFWNIVNWDEASIRFNQCED